LPFVRLYFELRRYFRVRKYEIFVDLYVSEVKI